MLVLLHILLLSGFCWVNESSKGERSYKFDEFRERWESLLVEKSVLGNCSIDKQVESDGSGESPLCGSVALRGRRPTQEDTLICIPEGYFPSLSGNIKYSLLGIFDGHAGKEASAICARCFHRYFIYHVYNISTTELFQPIFAEPEETYFWKIILKEALKRAIISAEDTFINNYAQYGEHGGTTACIALITEKHVLVANIGDSKALVCSSNKTGHLYTEELTMDHHPDRNDERNRIKSSGGHVSDWGGVPRVNGVLAVSRSIGDVPFKRYGVTSEPEFTGWIKITPNNKYLVLSSDGIFETLSTEDVCKTLELTGSGKNIPKAKRNMPIPLPPPDGTHSFGIFSYEEEMLMNIPSSLVGKMAATVAETAYKLGSSDNLAIIVYTLHEPDVSNTRKEHNNKQEIVRQCATDIMPVFSGLPEISVYKNPTYDAQFSYALMEPLERERISPIQYYAHDGGLQRFFASERLCLSTYPGTEEKLPANIQQQNPGIFCQFIDRIASVPVDMESSLSLDMIYSDKDINSPPFTVHHYRYILKKKFARGSFGEIWLAVRKECPQNEDGTCEWRFYDDISTSVPEDEVFVLKQILLNDDPSLRLSGLREKHFGEIFLNASRSQLSFDAGVNHIARFVDSFVVNDEHLWLVFKKEGQSLSKLLYESEVTTGLNASSSFQVLKPSRWWRWLKSTEEGQQEMRSLIHQLLLAVKACHDRNITHRDIKPENMVVQPADINNGMNLTLRIIDFGSAIDALTLQRLYGPSGPTRNEHTPEYAPPEALLLDHWMHFHPHQTKAFDIWSLGVVMLEIILGTPHVFQISSRTRLLLDKHLSGWDEDSKNIAYMLRAFMEMCILVPRVPPRYHPQEEGTLASMDCSEAALLRKLQQRDPMGLGVQDLLALRLLRLLLQWYPEDRISVDEALKHPYFQAF